jgi:hypothetical protein
MKAMRMFVVAFLMLTLFFVASAQRATNGNGGGLWSSASTWLGGLIPTGSENIIIMASDSIIYDQAVTITGSLTKMSSKKDTIAPGGSITFGNGSIYTHAVNSGSIPLATWATGSTCIITGVKDTVPSNNTQTFHNFMWSCSGQNKSLNLGWGITSETTINGNLIITNSGTSLANQFRLSSSSVAYNINIKGNVIVTPETGYVAYLSPSGSATPKEIFVTVEGDVIVSGGTSTIWAASNNSSATWTWKLYGNLTIATSCSLRTSGVGKFNFVKSGTQVVDMPTGVVKNGTSLLAAVSSGSTLNMGTSYFHVNAFTVDAGATLISASPTGLDGNIRTAAATLTFNAASNYIFNGSVAQVTGTIMPATVKNVTINNAAGVTSSQSLTITDTLFQFAGTLSGPYTAGVTTDVDEYTTAIPRGFFVNQNYPNPFNPSTMIKFGLPNDAFVSAKVYNLIGQEVATLFSGYKTAGEHVLQFDASRLSSGIYMYRIQAGNSVEVKRMMLVK